MIKYTNTVATIAKLTGASHFSIRRWTAEYADFLSPGAAPPEGEERRYNARDLQVLYYITTSRENKIAHPTIKAQLAEMESNGWQNLPEAPDQWKRAASGAIPVSEANERATQLTELATLQTQVSFMRRDLAVAEERADKLQAELDAALMAERTSASEIHELKLELERSRGEVATLRARLSQYALGGENPLSITALVWRVAVLVLTVIVLGAALGAVIVVLAT